MMDYSATEAVRFGQRLLEAGSVCLKRNKRNDEHWHVRADHDKLTVTLHGEINEDISVFLQQRMEF
jgi:hypothetical protein